MHSWKASIPSSLRSVSRLQRGNSSKELSKGSLRNAWTVKNQGRQSKAWSKEQLLPKILQQTLIDNVIVSLYQGDLTNEKDDAIVNPADAWLQYSQGVACAMVKKGGSPIINDSQHVMSRRGPFTTW